MAQPLWVNLLLLVPFVSYYFWRKERISLTGKHLLVGGLFAIAFGIVEAAVVVYLRAVLATSAGYGTSLSEVARFSFAINAATIDPPPVLPNSLLALEMCREAATMLMLFSLSLLAAEKRRERWPVFLWAFAIWDLTYYAALRATIGWPARFTDMDVLFLIPVPWISQVWFPILVSSLSVAAVLLGRSRVVAMATHETDRVHRLP
jgi:hypothetical protein